MADLNVLIVGASIAGPMAAYWFAKAGARVTVIERFPSLRTGGQNIDIRSIGVTVMRKIPGLEETIRAHLAPVDGISFVRDDGTPIAVMKSTGSAEQQSLVSEFEIYRGELGRILVDLTKDNERVKYIFDEQVAAIEQQGDGPLKVDFANHTASAEFDLVVACDGATSRTRAMGLGCGVRDHILPVRQWSAYWSVPTDYLQGDKIGRAIGSPRGRLFAAGADPSGSNRVVAMSVHPSIKDPALDTFREAQKQGTDAVKQLVKQRFAGMGWRTRDMLEELDAADDFYASELVQVKAPLHRGRFALCGDAGYASGPTGMGTSLALAGAYLLAGEVAAHTGMVQGDTPGAALEAGLAAYEARMAPLIKQMHVIPPGVLTIMAPQTAWGLAVRNFAFRVVCWAMGAGSVVGGVLGQLFGWMPALWSAALGSDAHGLPEYVWAS